MGRREGMVAFVITALAILVLFCAIFFVGDTSTGNSVDVKQYNRFKVIEAGDIDYNDYKIVYDVDTGVIYYYSNIQYNVGSLSPLYDNDGKLLLYGVGE